MRPTLDILSALIDDDRILASVAAFRVDRVADVVAIELDLRGWSEVGEPISASGFDPVVIRALGPTTWTLRSEAILQLSITDRHPALLHFEPAWARLSFRGTAADPVALRNALRSAEAEILVDTENERGTSTPTRHTRFPTGPRATAL